jgi:hypothetical protein
MSSVAGNSSIIRNAKTLSGIPAQRHRHGARAARSDWIRVKRS